MMKDQCAHIGYCSSSARAERMRKTLEPDWHGLVFTERTLESISSRFNIEANLRLDGALQMTEFEHGYELGSKIPGEECKMIIMEWNELEHKAIPLLHKPYVEMTDEEKVTVLNYETFWSNKLAEKACLMECSHEKAIGGKKAIFERGI